MTERESISASMGMKWPGIIVAVVVSLGLIVAIRYLITYLHPANQDIEQVMDDDDSEEVQVQGGRGGVGAGRGGRGRYKKQEVDTETHGALEFHLLEINEKEEGGESSGPGLGETVIIAIISIASLVILCIISGCVFLMWKCGLCPEGRRRRRTSSRSSTTGSSRKRPHNSEDSELGELRLKLRKLEVKSVKKEEEQEKKEKKEKELEMKEGDFQEGIACDHH